MRYLLQISSCAVSGREAEYNRWYEDRHLQDVLALPGFLTCERFERRSAIPPHAADFVAIYEVETEDPDALLASLFAAASTMEMTEALDPASPRFEILRPLGAKRRAVDIPIVS